MENLTIEEIASKEKILRTEILLLDIIKQNDLTPKEAEKVLTKLMFDVLVVIAVANKEDFADLHARVCASSFLVHLKDTIEESK